MLLFRYRIAPLSYAGTKHIKSDNSSKCECDHDCDDDDYEYCYY